MSEKWSDFRYYGGKALAGLGIGAAFLGILAFAVMLAALFAVPVAALLMLLIGILHSYIPEIPAYGFFPVYVATWVLSILRSILFGGVKVERR